MAQQNPYIQQASPTEAMIAPDIAAEQMANARRQAYAEMLRQQAIQPLQTDQIVSGHVVPVSWTQGLAKMLQAYSGANMADQADAKSFDLARQYQGRMMDLLRDDPQPAASPVGGSPNSQALGNALASGSSAPAQMGDPSATPIPSPAPAPVAPNPFNGRNLLRSQIIEQLGGKAMADQFAKRTAPDLTETARLSQEAGVPVQPYALSALNKQNALTVPDNGYMVLPNGQIMWGSDIKGGTFTATGPNGQPVSVAIPGATENAANRAGAIKRAELGAADPFSVPTPVDVKGGRVALTPAQQRAMANGGTDPAFPRVTPGQQAARDSDRAAILKQELASNPNDPALRKEAAAAGIPLMSPADQKLEEARGAGAVDSAKVAAAAQPLLATIAEAKKLVNDVPFGPIGIAEADKAMANMPFIGNDKKAAASARFEQLMGQLTMNGIASSGLGRMDIPIVNAIREASNVPLSDSPSAKMAKLQQLEKAIKDHVASTQNVVPNLNQPGITTNNQQTPMSPSSVGEWSITRVK